MPGSVVCLDISSGAESDGSRSPSSAASAAYWCIAPPRCVSFVAHCSEALLSSLHTGTPSPGVSSPCPHCSSSSAAHLCISVLRWQLQGSGELPCWPREVYPSSYTRCQLCQSSRKHEENDKDQV
ncbi:unnamed protein product [Boreogadus saida]